MSITANAAAKKNLVPATVNIENIYNALPENGSIKIWEGFGHSNGEEMFSRVNAKRIENGVAIINSKGQNVITFPLSQGRTMRTLLR